MKELQKIKEHFHRSIPEELRLLLWLSNPADAARAELPVPGQDFSWQNLFGLADRHRLLPSLARHLDALEKIMPAGDFSILTQKIQSHKLTVLQQTNEVLRIHDAFREKGIRVCILKGPVWATQLYGDATMRMSRDIDLLVHDADIDRFNAIFSELGYDPLFRFSPRQNRYYIKAVHHMNYLQHETNRLVEVHWRLFANRYLYPYSTADLFDKAQTYPIAGKEILTLHPDDMILYSCLHGSGHLWFRLHWLKDLSQIILNNNTDWQKIISGSKGAECSIEASLLLSNIIYDTPVLVERYNKQSLKLVRMSLKSIASKAYSSDVRGLKSIMANKHKELLLRRTVRYRISVFSLFITRFSDWKVVSLPDSLFFLYPILHPFIWLFRKKKK